MNLTEELERSFGNGPEHRPIEDRLVAGRRLVRRRRVAASAAALATAAVLGTVGVALGAGDGTSADTSVATQHPDEPEFMPGVHVRLDRDGTSSPDRGSGSCEGREPREVTPPDYSLGVVYTFEGDTYWALVETSGSSSEVARQSFPTFDYWLADEVALQDGDPTLALVEFGQGEMLLPRDGVEVLRQTGDLSMMPRNFAGPMPGRRWPR